MAREISSIHKGRRRLLKGMVVVGILLSSASFADEEQRGRQTEASPVLTIGDKEVFREDFGLTNPFEQAKVQGFYAYSSEDTYNSGVVGTWCISEVGKVKHNGDWHAYNFTHIWDWRLEEDGAQSMSWVVYRGAENADPFNLEAMDLWQRIEGRWRVGWRQLQVESPAHPVLISLFERSQVWKGDDVGQWEPTHDNEGGWVYAMKYRVLDRGIELGVSRPNGPDFTFVVDGLSTIGGTVLPDNFLIRNDLEAETSRQATFVAHTSWGALKKQLLELRP